MTFVSNNQPGSTGYASITSNSASSIKETSKKSAAYFKAIDARPSFSALSPCNDDELSTSVCSTTTPAKEGLMGRFLRMAMSWSEFCQNLACPGCGHGPYLSDLLPIEHPKEERKAPGRLVQLVAPATVSNAAQPSSFQDFSSQIQKELIRYCRMTANAYYDSDGGQVVLGVRRHSTDALNLDQEQVNKQLLRAGQSVEPAYDAEVSGGFVPMDLSRVKLGAAMPESLKEALTRHGFDVGGSCGHTISTSAGLAAKVFQRRIDDQSKELVLAFPGLCDQGFNEKQKKARKLAIFSNLSGHSLLHLQAQQLGCILARYKTALGSSQSKQAVQFTVTGHSLGGGFAMVVANVASVDQAIVFQPYPAFAGKLDDQAASKVIQVMVHRTPAHSFDPLSDGMIPAFVQHYHSGTHKIVAPSHRVLDQHNYLPHGSILSHLLMTFLDNTKHSVPQLTP